jgi:HlyD family secretion protein
VEGGRVERRLVEDGALVGAGTLLAVLSNPQLELEVTSREAQIAGGLSDVSGQRLALERTRLEREREISQANFELLKANRELQVHRSLHSKGFQSDARLEIATTEANYHRQRVAALQQGARQEAGLTAGQRAEIGRTADRLHGNLREVREGLRALEIRAPVAGRLTAFELQPGQAVQPRQRVGQVDSEGAYKLTAQIDEFYLGRVSVGQSATAEHEGRTYRLRVSRIVPQVQEGRFQTELEFVRETPPSLRRGQTLDLEVTLGDTRPALILPNGPFVETTGGTWVFVLEPGERRAERRTIRTGRRNPLEIEVLSGLKAGEQVVTSSYEGFARQSRLILR